MNDSDDLYLRGFFMGIALTASVIQLVVTLRVIHRMRRRD